MSKYYVVKCGKRPGIYNNWNECQEQISGYSGAIYKSFTTLSQAEEFYNSSSVINNKKNFIAPSNDCNDPTELVDDNTCVAYVDGSYNESLDCIGAGIVLLEKANKDQIADMDLRTFFNDNGVNKYTKSLNINDYNINMRNVNGEISATLYAVKKRH